MANKEAARIMGSKEMYGHSPKLERGGDGKMSVTNKKQQEKGSEVSSAGEEGEPVHVENEEAENMHSRHNLARHMLHAKHEHEHATHKGGSKEEMHERHSKEHGAMLKSHNEELAGAMEAHDGKSGE